MNTKNIIVSLLLSATAVHAAAAPQFDEIYQLLRTHLEGVSQPELDQAAVKGLLAQLAGQAALVENDSKNTVAAAANPLAKVTVFDNDYAYLRVGQVTGGLADKLRAAYDHLAQTNKTKLKGVVLDLRFAGGSDYAAAAAAADCFLNSDQPLLQWGAGSASSTKKTNSINLPLAILVNAQTTGAAEALAAALREASTGLILGATTAGQANIFKDFALANGDKLRIATAPIKLGDGVVLAHGVRPDIIIDATLADEKASLDDPYKNLHPALAGTNGPVRSQLAKNTNLPHRSMNEAELVRERRAGETEDAADDAGDSNADETPARPVIADAALARALDLLKGLAVMQQGRPG